MATCGPPKDNPPVVTADVDASLEGFGPEVKAEKCEFSFGLPKFALSFGFNLPSIAFPPALPSLNLAFSLSCDLANPVKVDADLKFGGGRASNADPDPDLEEESC